MIEGSFFDKDVILVVPILQKLEPITDLSEQRRMLQAFTAPFQMTFFLLLLIQEK